MTEMDRIRFTTVNYSRLQGLKAVPSGLLLFFITLWTNAQTGPARDLTIPLLLVAVGAVVYALIDRYYQRNYGRVEQKPKEFWVDILLSILGAGLALGAFVIDVSIWRPISIFALVFALGLFIDYLVMIRRAGGRSWIVFPFMPAVILLIGLTSLLPLAGRETWQAIGFRSSLFAVWAADGILVTLFGLIGHRYLHASMADRREAQDAKPV